MTERAIANFDPGDIPRPNTTTPRGGRVPPHDLDAEASLLGAMLLSAKAIAAAEEVGLNASDFYKPAHGDIYDAIESLHRRGEPADPVTVADELHRDGILDKVGGKPLLADMMTNTPAISSAARYARIIDEHARLRRLIGAAAELADLAYSTPDDVDEAETKALQLVASNTRPSAHVRSRLVTGGSFLLDEPDEIPAVWGHNDTVLWAEGEATMIVGPSGIGKTTLCQQVVLGRIGLRREVLGQPVVPGRHRVLYLAMDRPRQAARSMRRMVEEQDRELLDELVVFWKGPPPFDLVQDHKALARFAKDQGADTVIVDSLKDVCHKLSDDEHASKTNSAIQECIASGVEVGVLHHQRKAALGAKKTADQPKSLADVYGNVWLTAGMGSVLLIWGEAGDPIVELSHLKPPAEQVGPWTLKMDFGLGYTEIEEETTPLKIVQSSLRGATAQLVARLVFKTDEPSANQVEKARRRLEKLHAQGLVHRAETPTEGGGKPTTLYYPIDTRRTA